MRNFLLLCMMILALTACGNSGPSRETFPVIYTPPATHGGKLCLEQCSKSRTYCGLSCDLGYRADYAAAQSLAQKQYDSYATARLRHHLPVDQTPDDFQDNAAANAAKKQCNADCDRPYNACYVSCGGIVTPRETCFFCAE